MKYANTTGLLTSEASTIFSPEAHVLFDKGLMDEIPIIPEDIKTKILEVRRKSRNKEPLPTGTAPSRTWEDNVLFALYDLERFGWQGASFCSKSIFIPDYYQRFFRRTVAGELVCVEGVEYLVDTVTNRAILSEKVSLKEYKTGFFTFCKKCDIIAPDKRVYETEEAEMLCRNCGSPLVVYFGYLLNVGIVAFNEPTGYEEDVDAKMPEFETIEEGAECPH